MAEAAGRGPTPDDPRVAVVTGASAGIGRAIATAFGGLGWTVAIGARRPDRLAETATAIEEAGGRPVAHPLDVTDEDAVDAFFDAVESAAGPVDVLVNNAGVGYLGAVADERPERFRLQLDTNVLGPLLCSRRALRSMLGAARGGDLVFISSESVNRGYPHMLTYGATKAAVEYLATGLTAELAGSGIRSTVVRLGPTVSEFNTGWPDEDMIGFMEAWDRLGLKQDFNYIPADHAARAVVEAVTIPRGTRVSVIAVEPETTLSDDAATRWADAADQGRSRT